MVITPPPAPPGALPYSSAVSAPGGTRPTAPIRTISITGVAAGAGFVGSSASVTIGTKAAGSPLPLSGWGSATRPDRASFRQVKTCLGRASSAARPPKPPLQA